MNQKIINKRLNILENLVYILFFIISIYLIENIYVDRNYYKEKLDSLTNIYVYGDSSPRGRIYDRNYNLLVDNQAVYEIVYKKDNNVSRDEEIELIYEVIKHIDLDYTKIHERNLKEFYLLLNPEECSKKITSLEYDKLKQRILNIDDIENLKISRITIDDLNSFTLEDRKAAYLYYLMNSGYSYSEKIIKNKNVSYSEYAYFSEHIDTLKGFNTKITWERIYLYGDTFKSILGNIGSIPRESKDDYIKLGYSINDIVGVSNIEKQYEDILKGSKAVYRKINNNTLELVKEASRGNDIVLSVDINLIKEIDSIIDRRLIKAKGEANTKYLSKTYVIIQEPNTGEILAISGRQLLNNNNSYDTYDITSYALTDPMAPGSVVKGASMLVGFNSGVVKPGEVMLDECIKLYNLPKKCSSHYIGKMDDLRALAESSNVYQFKIAMKIAGINYSYNTRGYASKENFDLYRNTFKQFGLGVKTEIDLPIESLGYSGNKYTIDLLLNYAIGQYDTYTPIQLSQYITTLASNGNRLKPHFLKEVYDSSDTMELGKLLKKEEPTILNKVDTSSEYLERIKTGFISVMEDGLGRRVMGDSPNPAGKTGTSESFLDTNKDGVIDTPTISQSFIGYAPSNNPKMTITVTTPDIGYINNTNSDHLTYVNRLIAREISNKYFEMFPID